MEYRRDSQNSAAEALRKGTTITLSISDMLATAEVDLSSSEDLEAFIERVATLARHLIHGSVVKITGNDNLKNYSTSDDEEKSSDEIVDEATRAYRAGFRRGKKRAIREQLALEEEKQTDSQKEAITTEAARAYRAGYRRGIRRGLRDIVSNAAILFDKKSEEQTRLFNLIEKISKTKIEELDLDIDFRVAALYGKVSFDGDSFPVKNKEQNDDNNDNDDTMSLKDSDIEQSEELLRAYRAGYRRGTKRSIANSMDEADQLRANAQAFLLVSEDNKKAVSPDLAKYKRQFEDHWRGINSSLREVFSYKEEEQDLLSVVEEVAQKSYDNGYRRGFDAGKVAPSSEFDREQELKNTEFEQVVKDAIARDQRRNAVRATESETLIPEDAVKQSIDAWRQKAIELEQEYQEAIKNDAETVDKFRTDMDIAYHQSEVVGQSSSSAENFSKRALDFINSSADQSEPAMSQSRFEEMQKVIEDRFKGEKLRLVDDALSSNDVVLDNLIDIAYRDGMRRAFRFAEKRSLDDRWLINALDKANIFKEQDRKIFEKAYTYGRKVGEKDEKEFIERTKGENVGRWRHKYTPQELKKLAEDYKQHVANLKFY